MDFLHWLVRKSSFSKAQGLHETGSWCLISCTQCTNLPFSFSTHPSGLPLQKHILFVEIQIIFIGISFTYLYHLFQTSYIRIRGSGSQTFHHYVRRRIWGNRLCTPEYITYLEINRISKNAVGSQLKRGSVSQHTLFNYANDNNRQMRRYTDTDTMACLCPTSRSGMIHRCMIHRCMIHRCIDIILSRYFSRDMYRHIIEWQFCFQFYIIYFLYNFFCLVHLVGLRGITGIPVYRGI